MRELADTVFKYETRKPYIEFKKEKMKKENIDISPDFVIGEESGVYSGYLILYKQPEFY
jgi:hypothetical protein